MADAGDGDGPIDFLEAANNVVNNDRHRDTIKGYRSKIAQMRKYARDSDDWDEDDIFDNPPLPEDFLKIFLGKLIQPKENGTVRTASTMRSYVSAIKWWYSTLEGNVEISTDLQNWLTQFNTLGLHSVRKASAIYASSFPGGPGRDAIYQRADWSLGNVRDRSVSASAAGAV